jgi:hypothetical protein
MPPWELTLSATPFAQTPQGLLIEAKDVVHRVDSHEAGSTRTNKKRPRLLAAFFGARRCGIAASLAYRVRARSYT